MNQPTVCALMLTADRPALAKRAVECFRAQTYRTTRLYIYDSGVTPDIDCLPDNYTQFGIAYHRTLPNSRSVGQLRNDVLHFCASDGDSDIICHWDDDDWSHPNRITEQVALMESTGADVCGYNQMLFWRQNEPIWRLDETITSASETERIEISAVLGLGEAWLYTGSILGTSLMYRRAVWERFPFPDTSYGEDTDWLKRVQHAKVRVAADSSMNLMRGADPRMIARIHAGNTSKAYAPKAMKEAPHHWSRAPKWDEFCRSVME